VAIARTEGVSAAFIKELLRRAALVAADTDPGGGEERLTVTDRHLLDALHELVTEGDPLTRTLLGASPPTAQP
jgi:hypothetical protein